MLLPLVFISVLIGIFNYIKVLPFIIKYVGIAINKITRMGRLESYFAISTAMFGQPEVYLTIKILFQDYLERNYIQLRRLV